MLLPLFYLGNPPKIFFSKKERMCFLSPIYELLVKYTLGKLQKKIILLMAGPLRPNPPPPSSLMAVEIFERLKKGSKKSSFFLNGLALYPPPAPA